MNFILTLYFSFDENVKWRFSKNINDGEYEYHTIWEKINI